MMASRRKPKQSELFAEIVNIRASDDLTHGIREALGGPRYLNAVYVGCSNCQGGLPMRGEETCPQCGAALLNYRQVYGRLSEHEYAYIKSIMDGVEEYAKETNMEFAVRTAARDVARFLTHEGPILRESQGDEYCRHKSEILIEIAVCRLFDELRECRAWDEFLSLIGEEPLRIGFKEYAAEHFHYEVEPNDRGIVSAYLHGFLKISIKRDSQAESRQYASLKNNEIPDDPLRNRYGEDNRFW